MSLQKKSMEELQRPSLEAYQAFAKNPIVLILDNIRSMQNVGAIYRTADAFCIEKILLLGITPAPPHRDIHRASLGAERSVEWKHLEKASQIQSEIDDRYQIISIEQAEPSTLLHHADVDPGKSYALVLGNEVHGVSQEVLDISDLALEIQQCGTKHSLNVATTAGIVLYHFTTAMR